MKLHLSIEYVTHWGEQVCATVILKDQSGCTIPHTYPLETKDGRHWKGEIRITITRIRSFNYYYSIYKGDTPVRKEWDLVPRSFRADTTKTFFMQDVWREVPAYAHLYTSAFTRCILPHAEISEDLSYFSSTIMLRVNAPSLLPRQTIAVLGNQPALGEWNPNFAFPMKETGLHQWSVTFSALGLTFPIEYKYVVVDAETGALVQWEEGANRTIPVTSPAKDQVIVVSDTDIRIPVNRWKAAGVVVPVFSLRSEGSQGVGDFGDLRSMVDWAVRTSMHVIQILPVYDTTINKTWLDSYPYNSISIYALHPQYIDLRQLPPLDDQEAMNAYTARRAEINNLPEVDYEAVSQLKQNYLKAIFHQEGTKVLSSEEYLEFFKQNQDWLIPYAAFSVLRDRFKTADFHSWPEHSKYSTAAIRIFCSPDSDNYHEVSFYYYIQYQLHRQLSAASAYARANKVILKGDIPIGISKNSVEAWIEPYYFNIDSQTGAPPDDFSVNGQNWGFPTYNWEAMFKDGCNWWIQRFRKMAQYFDAYRIDHVLGFFRIWEIPSHSVHGLLGHFSPAKPLSVDEIESFGLRFRPVEFTMPYITDRILNEKFGKKKEEIKATYLYRPAMDRYAFKPAFDTQRKIQTLFQNSTLEKQLQLRDNLYELISDVLFIPDPYQPDKYNPRISGYATQAYKSLNKDEKKAFDNLYEDYFFHRHNEFWYQQAMRRLPMLIQATPMLACAEDLGMVPACVPWVMNELRILTLEIQTMPKQFGTQFSRLEENPYRSVATIFTHDMPTLRLWWKEDTQRTAHYYNQILQKDGPAPEDIPAWLAEEVVARHLYSPSMLCLISWQDWLSIDEQLRRPDITAERINVPADSQNYWRYRMHLTIEQLLRSDQLNEKIHTLIQRSGR